MLSNQITEALTYLNPQNVKDIDFSFERDSDGSDEGLIKTNPPLSKLILIIVKLISNV